MITDQQKIARLRTSLKIEHGHVTKACATIAALTLKNDGLRKALGDIHVSAHCIAKAGPLRTRTLADVWAEFGALAAKATSALSVYR